MVKMKDSGVEWIGEIPEDWDVVKIKYLLENKKNAVKVGPFGSQLAGMDILSEGEYWVYNQRAVLDDNYTTSNTFISEKKYKDLIAFAVSEGDILITTRGSIGKVSKVPQEHYAGVIHPCIIKFNIEDNLYLYDLLKYIFNESDMVIKQVQYNSNSTTIDVIYSDTLKNIILPYMPVSQQQRIVKYLDVKIGQIDSVIEKTKATIEDYKKYKQSVITDALTKGIVTGRSLKDTGNIHIDQIPAEWDMNKMKYIFYIKKDIAGKEGYDILSITQKGIKIKDISHNEGQLASDYSKYQLVNVGDFAMNHMDLLTGWVDTSPYSGVTSPDYRVFNFIDNTKYSRKYYLYLMQMCYMNRIFYGLGQGVSNLGRWRLQADKFMNFSVPVPPLDEQNQIADYLDAKCAEIEKLIASKEALIEEMKSYKKSVIYEYVTGKKEVL